MARLTFTSMLFASTLVTVAFGQQPLYSLCGGKAWTGPTECVEGAVCVVLNEFWSQCLLPAPTTTLRAPSRTIEARDDPTTSPLAPLYSFCGEGAWATAKECVPGAVCHYVNQYWSQCIPVITQTP
ncbi:hypothetical protein BJ165DRAFT_1478831 [Panaeolus papilionaceus]|nr:hypothetical protein BJ165DRAFT_1478831 [Panaeolus papilionaceus]